MDRPTVTFPVTEHHRRLAGTKLYCWMTQVVSYVKVATYNKNSLDFSITVTITLSQHTIRYVRTMSKNR